MVLIEIAGLAICFPANLLANFVGSHCENPEDKDLLLPFASILFTFYPLIISLPEAHFKLIKYSVEQSLDEPIN